VPSGIEVGEWENFEPEREKELVNEISAETNDIWLNFMDVIVKARRKKFELSPQFLSRVMEIIETKMAVF